MGKKKTPDKKRFLVMKNGEKIQIVGEKGKYWLCERTQFSKSNPMIASVELEVQSKEPSESLTEGDAVNS